MLQNKGPVWYCQRAEVQQISPSNPSVSRSVEPTDETLRYRSRRMEAQAIFRRAHKFLQLFLL